MLAPHPASKPFTLLNRKGRWNAFQRFGIDRPVPSRWAAGMIGALASAMRGAQRPRQLNLNVMAGSRLPSRVSCRQE